MENSTTKQKTDFILCVFVIIASLSQISLGAAYSTTGEQIKGGFPLSTLVLCLCGFILVIRNFKKTNIPGINLLQTLFIIALSSSLLGLPSIAEELAIKELAQIYEIFIFSYVVFLINRELILDVLKRCSFYIALTLLVLHLCDLNSSFPFYLSDTKLEAFIIILTPFIILNISTFSFPGQLISLGLLSFACGISFTNGGLLLCFLLIFSLAGCLFLNIRKTILSLTLLTLVFSLISVDSKNAWDTLNPDYYMFHKKRLFIEYAASLKAPTHFPIGVGPGSYKKGINYLKKLQPLTPHKEDIKIARDSNSQYQIYLVEAGPVPLFILIIYFLSLIFSSLRIDNKNDKYLRVLLLFTLISTALFCVIFSRGIGIFAGAILAVISSKRFSKNESFLYPVNIAFASIMFFVLLIFKNQGYDTHNLQSPYNRLFVHKVLGMHILPVNKRLEIIPYKSSKAQKKIITYEAEDATEILENFKIVPANDSSGNKVIEIPNDSGKGLGKAEYDVEIPAAGSYTLFARVWWEDGCSNSVAIEIGELPQIIMANEIFKKWQIIEAIKPISLEKGKYKLKLINLEDGIKVDYFGFKMIEKE